ncbi:MAG TPA: hypothetical protein VM582_05300 [Candidatus Thermoplasmatota archaeon]|nr:hypothetical protein [Candidatus Thermoplasmatota archaeon]
MLLALSIIVVRPDRLLVGPVEIHGAITFVALFFVVSELAATLFSERMGTVLGIMAAGALLFALAPLQRVAERVADAAMPRVKETDESRMVRKREVYRAAVESALHDGVVTAREHVPLAHQLGLSAGDARALEGEVEAASQGRRVRRQKPGARSECGAARLAACAPGRSRRRQVARKAGCARASGARAGRKGLVEVLV